MYAALKSGQDILIVLEAMPTCGEICTYLAVPYTLGGVISRMLGGRYISSYAHAVGASRRDQTEWTKGTAHSMYGVGVCWEVMGQDSMTGS